MNKTETTWTRDKIDTLLHTSSRAVERAMVALFKLQTEDEQRDDQTRHSNNKGFCSWAARKGGYYAKWVESGRHLTGHHLERARKIALKHSNQLVKIAQS
jgi:hypothetical protein